MLNRIIQWISSEEGFAKLCSILTLLKSVLLNLYADLGFFLFILIVRFKSKDTAEWSLMPSVLCISDTKSEWLDKTRSSIDSSLVGKVTNCVKPEIFQ